jgi:surface protein
MSEFTLPLRAPDAGHTVLFKVEWGDGSTEVISYDLTSYNNDPGTLLKHEYTIGTPAGGFVIKIYPPSGEKFGKYWGYPDGNSKGYADRTKLKEIKKWGCFEFNNLGYSFAGCSNLNISATDTTANPAKPSFYPSSLDSAFKNCTSLNPVGISAAAETAFNSFNTLAAVSMNHTFLGCTSFNTNINNWNVLSVTNFNSTFSGATNFNPSNGLNDWTLKTISSGSGITMQSTFYEATSFNKPLSNWDTSRVINLTSAFNRASAFNQDISGWNVSNATSMVRMFELATSFNNNNAAMDWGNNDGGAASWELTNMSNMFLGASGFNQSPGTWNTEAVTNLDATFSGATNFNQDLSSWNIANVTTATNMFSGSGQDATNAEATNTSWQTQDSSSPAAQESQNTLPMEPMIINIDLDLPNNSGQTNNDWGFIHQAIDPVNTAFTVDWGDGAVDTYTDNASAKTRTHTYATGGQKQVKITGGLTSFGGSGGNTSLYGPKVTSIASWGELPLTSLAHACYQCKNIQSVPNSIPSTVTNLNNMFDSCYDFNDPSVSSWDTINVVGMAGMFRQCHNFNQSLNSWNVSNVLIMNQMFAYCRVLTQSFSNWNPAKVNNMSQMFQNQASSTRPVAGVGPTGLGSWDVGKVENFSAMFEYCAEDFNPDVTNWNVSSATNLQTMFAHTAMNRSLASWDVSNVQYMHALFRDTSPSVNLGLSNWNTSSVTDTSYMFMGVDCSQIGSLFTSGGMLLTTTSSMFSGATVTEAQAGEIATWHTSALTTANGMFSGTSLTTSGYDAILNGWATASAGEGIPSNINFSAGDSQYSPAAASSRNTLASSSGYNWTIVDGGPNDNWIRVGSVNAPAHSAYGSNAMEDWRLASWNDEDIWRFQQQMPGEDITYNGIVYSGGASEKTLNTSLISAVGSYSNASLGGTTNGGSHSQILVKQTENGNYSTLPGSPSKDYLVEIKVGSYIRWGASDPGVGGKLEESETVAFTLDDSAWPNSVGDGWYFINSHNAATGNNKVFKVNSQGQITQVINCADIFSSGYNIPVYTPPCVNVTSTTVSWSDLFEVDFSLQGGVGTSAWYHYVNVGGNQEFKIEWGSGSRWELLRKGNWAGAQWELLGHNLGGDNPLSTAWSHSTGWPAGSITVVACA